jgi:L-fucose mutarotase
LLKGIDQVLRGELLKALDELGHGDEFVLVDRNFPAYSSGLEVIDLGEIKATRAAKAIFSVFPLDVFGDEPVSRMAYNGKKGISCDSLPRRCSICLLYLPQGNR